MGGRRRLGLLAGLPVVGLAAAIGFMLFASSCSGADDDTLPGAGRSITVARGNWSTGYFQAQLYSTLLQRLGYEVADPADHEMSTADFFEAVARGEADLSPNGWFPTTQTERTLEDGGKIGDFVSPVGEQMSLGAVQGILIDSGTAEKHQIVELDEIAADPKLAQLFDIDGNGKADVFGCPEDWNCDDVIDEVISAAGGQDTIEQIKADYDANFLAFKRRVLAGEPALAYTWTPNFTVALLRPGNEVKWLSVVPQGFDATEVPLSMQRCTKSPCVTGWPASDIRVIANNNFLESEPAARALLEAVKIPAPDVYAQNLEMDRGADSPEDIQASVDRWIQNNRALVVDWLAYARSKA